MAKSRRDAAAGAGNSAHPEIAALERPNQAGSNAPGFGSDVVAETLRDLDIPYIALNPGASYRGLHDSLVNYLGNAAPQMLSACTRKRRSRSRTVTPRSPAGRWRRRSTPMSG
jgi:hypothetical protein